MSIQEALHQHWRQTYSASQPRRNHLDRVQRQTTRPEYREMEEMEEVKDR